MSKRVTAWIALALLAAAAATAAQEEMVDGIAAQVGGKIVLVSEVMDMVASREARARAAGVTETEIAMLRADALEQLIEWRLIEQIVRQTEMYASDAEIDNTIQSIASENGISVAQVKASVAAQGLPYQEYREQIKREIERRKVVNTMVASRVRVEEPEIEALYTERFTDQPKGGVSYHLRQILVSFGGPEKRDPAEACQEVRGALTRIQAGEPFETLATEISDVSPRYGGDIGWLHSGSLANWMSAVVDSLQVGQTSDVIELPFGCSVLKLVERKDFTPITLEEARPRLQQEIFEKRVGEELSTWMEELRASTYIERYGYFADAAQLGSQSPYAKSPDEPEEALLP
jgi:peptidyl-prolyl cis-trans isomerase SurA